MANCTLPSCGSKYTCVQNPFNSVTCVENRLPFVSITFLGSGGSQSTVTTGTSDSSSGSSACNPTYIKSFQYGNITFAGGCKCKVEIIDENGGVFNQWIENLIKNVKDADTTYKMQVQFGWKSQSNANCGGIAAGGNPTQTSPIFYFIPDSVEAKLEGNKIRFEITGIDLMTRAAEVQYFGVYPKTPGQTCTLVEAISQLRKDTNFGPTFNVIYKVVTPGNQVNIAKTGYAADEMDPNFRFEWGDSFSGQKGPQGIWYANSRHPLSVIQDWIKAVRCPGKLGITTSWHPATSTPTLVIWQDGLPAQCEALALCDRVIRHYIVNGGNCSTVLSFSPNIRWTSPNVVGGGQDLIKGKVTRIDDDPLCQNVQKKGGNAQVNLAPPTASQTPAVTGKSTDALAGNIQAHYRANRTTYYPVEADLKVVGDPTLAHPVELYSKTVSLVVINPFFLSDQTPCTWVASGAIGNGNSLNGSVCNKFLTNTGWMIRGTEHTIREGSYTTTLKLFMAQPDADQNAAVAGAQGGDTPQNQ